MTVDPAVFTAQEFQAQALAAINPGEAWSRNPSSILSAIAGLDADVVALVHSFAVQLLDVESDPRTAELALSDWEDRYGLPDPCTPLAPTVAQRQAALAARLIATGGQSIPYFTAIAAVFGAAIEVQSSMPSACGPGTYVGQLYAGAPLLGPAAVGEWQVTVAAGFAGNQAQFECTLRRYAPAQSYVTFIYS